MTQSAANTTTTPYTTSLKKEYFSHNLSIPLSKIYEVLFHPRPISKPLSTLSQSALTARLLRPKKPLLSSTFLQPAQTSQIPQKPKNAQKQKARKS
mmetsp:Transcript_34558/g.40007  ORF Transcript_34558/g.40007 Transcript_34558/m.40007 type:complete len:96 (-) Transcript_34558:80-367(-)